MKKTFSWLLALLIVLAGCSAPSTAAEEWRPSGPITIVQYNEPGGATDLEVRALMPALERMFGVPIIAEYETAANGTVALLQLARARPDGQRILKMSAPALCIRDLTGGNTGLMENFDFLVNVMSEYRVLAARPHAPYKTLEEMIEYSKAGNILTVSHSGTGSSAHLQTLQIAEALGIQLNDVPFDGSGPARVAFLGDHVNLWAIDVPSALTQVRAGEAVVLAYCAETRHPEMPDVPTFRELGYDVISSFSRGYIAPKGLPQNVKDRLIQVIVDAIHDEEFSEFAERTNTSINIVTGDDYYKMIEDIYNTVKQFVHLF